MNNIEMILKLDKTMRINNVVKFNLESRAKELKWQGKSLGEIADTLSDESGQVITRSAAYRYFESNDKIAAQMVEKNDKLKIKIVETEINTISKRLEIIDGLLKIAEQAQESGDLRAAILALRAATEAQDSLDNRLGKLKTSSNTNNINILNIQEEINGARESFISAIVAANTGTEEI
jgi:multidrug efflux pump subunit AcrA (membrane-fusion protein)